MKRQWTVDELIDQWTLLPSELDLVEASKTDHNYLGFARPRHDLLYTGLQ